MERYNGAYKIHKACKHICLIGLMELMSIMGSCQSGEEPLQPTTKPDTTMEMPITFSGHESEAQETNKTNAPRAITRASTPLNELATSFTVWGYKNMTESAGAYDADASNMQTVFSSYTVNWQDNSAATTTTNSSGWEYILLSKPSQTIKYWDWGAKAYRFYGVTGIEGDFSTYGNSGTYGPAGAYKTREFTMATDASTTAGMAATPYYTHLWFSTGNVEEYPTQQFGNPVQLEFLKPYTRVRFMFNYTFPREGIELRSKSFAPTDGSNIARKGTVTITYPLTGTETKEWFSMTANSNPDLAVSKALTAFTEDCDPEDDSKVYTETDKGWYTVMPNNTQGSYTLSVKVNGETKYCSVPAAYMAWQPGFCYTYVFKITDEGGVEIGWVEYAVVPWTQYSASWETYNW